MRNLLFSIALLSLIGCDLEEYYDDYDWDSPIHEDRGDFDPKTGSGSGGGSGGGGIVCNCSVGTPSGTICSEGRSQQECDGGTTQNCNPSNYKEESCSQSNSGKGIRMRCVGNDWSVILYNDGNCNASCLESFQSTCIQQGGSVQ